MPLPPILHVASEAYPFAKSGGLGDVLGSLPTAQQALGAEVALVLPAYPWIAARASVAPTGVEVYTPSVPRRLAWRVERTDLGGVPVFLLRCDSLFRRPHLYGEKGGSYPDNTVRFGLFARAVLEMLRELQWRPRVLHLHDWHAALGAVYLRLHYGEDPHFFSTRTVLTIHNLAYQGLGSPADLTALDLPAFLFHPDLLEFWGRLNPLKGGILFADYLTTVSPTYAREIQTPAMGCGLDGVLRQARDRLAGILNGMDTRAWDPARDAYLPQPYTVATWREGKARARALLREVFRLAPDARMVAGFIGRLTEQKGVDLLLAALPGLVAAGVQVVLLGTGEPRLEAACRAAAARWAGRVGAHVGYEERLAHLIQGGADLLLMPSRYEPCGLSQLHALRYGTVPVVHPVGGLRDTVQPAGRRGGAQGATGFYIESLTPAGIAAAVQEALAFAGDPDAWGALVTRAMAQDFSWERSAAAYLALYHSVAVRRERPAPIPPDPPFPRPAARPRAVFPAHAGGGDCLGPYGEDTLALMVQSPTVVFCYWELTEGTRRLLGPEARLVLLESDSGRETVVTMPPPLLGDYWFPAHPEGTYQVAWVTRTGRPVLLSNRVRTPRAGPAAGGRELPRRARASLAWAQRAARLAARDRALLGLEAGRLGGPASADWIRRQ